MPNEKGFTVFNSVDNKANYTRAFVAFGIGALLLLFSIFSLPTIILSPQKFTMFFTFSMISFLVGLAYMNGPQTYLKKLTAKKSLV